MIVTITYSERRNQRHGNWLLVNLKDMVDALDKELRTHNQASCRARFFRGRVEIVVVGADRKTVEPYITAFYDRLSRDSLRFFVNYG